MPATHLIKKNITDTGTLARVCPCVQLAVVGLLVVYAAYVSRKRKLKMAPHDFEQQLQDMINQGIIKEVKPGEQRRIPDELPRSSIVLIDILGAGEFGEVMKVGIARQFS